MSRRRERSERRRAAREEKGRGAPAESAPAATRTAAQGTTPLSAARRAVFLAITLLVPVLLLALAEIALRVAGAAGDVPLFVPSQVAPAYDTPNPEIASRWFMVESHPPAPNPGLMARRKPANGFRVFVLGESTAAGFPYPRNATFSRLLEDVLRDVLPDDSVEVINVAVPATNSYGMVDVLGEVLDRSPDALLVYAGHNEYYGALGVASRESALASPSLVRLTLRLQRFRVVWAMRRLIGRLRGGGSDATADNPEVASFMETLARDREVPLGSDVYRRGLEQFESNMRLLLQRAAGAGVPVFVGSQVSNIRDQHPFASPTNAADGGADDTYAQAEAAIAAGDTVRAREAFIRARDLDVVRFRAPSDLNDIVRRVSAEEGAIYVPVAETFDSAATGHMPGSSLILEHVHPTIRGYALIGRAYFDALRAQGFAGRRADLTALRDWSEYVAGQQLTPFDERVAEHTVATITSRWPFVPASEQRDYRGTYRPTGVADSLALLVSRGGMTWQAAKLELAKAYAASGLIDSSVAEFEGLARDVPVSSAPLRLAARALLADSQPAAAESLLVAAEGREPSADGRYQLGLLAASRHEYVTAIAHFEASLQLAPTRALVWYRLSLVYGLERDLARARSTALRANQLDPRVPGLAGWLNTIGARP